MGGYYARHVSTTLAAKLAEASEETAAMRHSLEEEIDLARIITSRAAKIFSAVCLEDREKEVSQELKVASITALKDALRFVVDVVEKSARVRALDSSVLEAETVQWLAHQMMRSLRKHLGEEHPAIDDLMADVQRLKFPSSQTGNVDPTQAAAIIRNLVADMDTTVVGSSTSNNGASNGSARTD